MLKKILKSKDGMALITVLGIIAVITILATGLFVFSSNEMNFSRLNLNREQSNYFARSAVEISAKAFPGVASEFDFNSSEPITADLHLHQNGNIDSADNCVHTDSPIVGTARVVVTQESRTINIVGSTDASNNKTYSQDVILYTATATVGKAKSTAKGYSMPPASVFTKPAGITTNTNYLNWTDSTGRISSSIITGANSPYAEAQSNNVPAGFLETLINLISGTNYKIYYTSFRGVVSALEKDYTGGKIYVEPVGTLMGTVCIWSTPSIILDASIDMRNRGAATCLAIVSDTMVFGGEINVWRNRWPIISNSNFGTVILQPLGDSAKVYFKNDIYRYRGSNRTKIISKGVYTLTGKLDLLNATNAEIAQVLTENTTDSLQSAPTVTSLTKVVWE